MGAIVAAYHFRITFPNQTGQRTGISDLTLYNPIQIAQFVDLKVPNNGAVTNSEFKDLVSVGPFGIETTEDYLTRGGQALVPNIINDWNTNNPNDQAPAGSTAGVTHIEVTIPFSMHAYQLRSSLNPPVGGPFPPDGQGWDTPVNVIIKYKNIGFQFNPTSVILKYEGVETDPKPTP